MELPSVSHDELSDLLQSLPRLTASSGFTAQTLVRIGARRRPVRRLRAALAMVLSAILILSGAVGIRRHQQQMRDQQLRIEQQQLRKELEELKALSTERKPQVFVGSSGSIDFVVGVTPRPRPANAAAQPVSLQISDDGTY